VATSASWALVMRAPSGTSSTGAPLTLSFPASLLSVQSQYPSVDNLGSVVLTAGTYTASSTGLNLGSISMTACVGGTWNQVLGTCSGTAQAIALNASGTATTVVPTAPGANLPLKVSVAAVLASAITVTIGTSAASGPGGSRQIAAAATTNS
jgi:hypothetical protein